MQENSNVKEVDVIVIGAGAAGLMCAIEAGKRGCRVVLLDHANKLGKKILMSGGGRCNFTNRSVSAENYISHNPHFCKSALSRYTPNDFIALVEKYKIPFHEKTLGQLFCDHKSSDIVQMLVAESERVNVTIQLKTSVSKIQKKIDSRYRVTTTQGVFQCRSLVIASGGLSIPTMGASPFGYKVAEQFGLKVWSTRAGLVPLTLHTKDKEELGALAGIAVNTQVSVAQQAFYENILFTHRGLSGPAILQISSYWQPGEALCVDLFPSVDIGHALEQEKLQKSNRQIKSWLMEKLPKRLVEVKLGSFDATKKLRALSSDEIITIRETFHNWELKPNGTEGYRTAEVTLGGVDTSELSSKTFETKKVPGLYFIGEVVDVTGWLGGYNFQWAWASGWAAGQAV